MQRVSQATALRHWLRLEQERPGADPIDVEALDEAAIVDRLLQHKPGAAAFIWRDAPIDWYRVELSREEFLELQVVPGPEDLSWRGLGPEDTIESVAEWLAREYPEMQSERAGIDVSKIQSLLAEMPTTADRPLVLSTRRGCVPWSIADGNHRAVAKAYYLLKEDIYRPQTAYLGVGRNPVAAPLRERVCGLLRRLLRPSSGPAVQA